MGRISSIVMGALAVMWGASAFLSGPDLDAHPTSRGWGQPPLWIGPNPYQQLFGVFLVVWGAVFIYLGLRRKKLPPESN